MNIIVQGAGKYYVRYSQDLKTVEEYGPFLNEPEAEDFADELESLETPLQRRERWEEKQPK